jgi:hypothetical protein
VKKQPLARKPSRRAGCPAWRGIRRKRAPLVDPFLRLREPIPVREAALLARRNRAGLNRAICLSSRWADILRRVQWRRAQGLRPGSEPSPFRGRRRIVGGDRDVGSHRRRGRPNAERAGCGAGHPVQDRGACRRWSRLPAARAGSPPILPTGVPDRTGGRAFGALMPRPRCTVCGSELERLETSAMLVAESDAGTRDGALSFGQAWESNTGGDR